MNKIKALFSNKKIVAIFSVVLLLIVGVSGFAYHNHNESQKRIAEELRLKEEKAKEEALAKKVDEAKKVLDEKLENEDKLSTEDKAKLEAVKKQLTEAIEKKDEQNIIKLQNELKTALNTAKTSITKLIAEEKEAEEKRLAEEKRKDEEAKQQAEATASNATPRPTNNAPTTQPTKRTQASTGTVNNNSGTTTTQPTITTPAPQPEKPKERKPIADWMKVGNSGKIFKTKEEAVRFAESVLDVTDKDEIVRLSAKYNVPDGELSGYWLENIQYTDGTIEWTIDFK